MGDEDGTLPSLKKRTAERQLTKENFGLDDDEDTSGQDSGTFRRASDEVLAQRKIVKVRRPSGVPSAASNPFAGIRLVSPANSSAISVAVTSADESVKSVSDDIGQNNGGNQDIEKIKDESDKKSDSKVEEAGTELTVDDERTKTEGRVDDKKVQSSADEPATKSAVEDERTKTEGKVEDDKKMQSSAGEPETGKDNTDTETRKPESIDVKTEGVDESKIEAKPDANDKKSENEERNSGEGVDKQKDGATPFSSFQQLSSSQNAFTGVAGSGFSSSTFSFGPISKNGSTVDSGFSKSTLFRGLGSSVANRGEVSGIMQEVAVETGEENEKAVFTADSLLFEFLDGGWKERGKGEIKVNVSTVGTGKARLVMRARGNYRLILNASLYSGMKLTAMEKKGVTFACMNSNGEGKKNELSTFALKFKDASIVEEFRAVVTEHTRKSTTGLKTPENSP
ncbi:Nuclear pore complex protein like [Heracleum sosnowskyi]|uniref:Nuclear pore complex protein like n=1 Tax=Heracleum sosnowskyi TaxID=360622 RepID=A0AAD8HYV4_9APIA|nr:Nuclear pore complex protein like [Heracleum sosnowskyi]